MRKAIKILLGLLFVFTVTDAQYVNTANGQLVVSYGSFTRSIAKPEYGVTTPTPDPPTAFNTILDMDFDNEVVTAWTQALAETWAATYTDNYDISVFDSYSGELVNIVYSEIYTGVQSKVLEIGQRTNELYHGFESDFRFPGDTIYQEVYLSFLFKFEGENTYLNAGGKLAGLTGLPFDPQFNQGNPIRSGWGNLNKMNFSEAKIYDYHYTQDNPVGSSPWSSLTERVYYNDSVYMAHGNWYVLTIRVVINTYSGGPVSNSIMEGWINGKMIFNVSGSSWFDEDLIADDYYDYSTQSDIDNIGITALTMDHFYGGDGNAYQPHVNMKGYFARLVVYKSEEDPTWGTHDLHDPDDFLVQPIPLPTNNQYFYDALIISEGSFVNGNYSGTAWDTCTSNHYLIQSPPDEVVRFIFTTSNWASNSHLMIYDGDTVTSPFLYVSDGVAQANLSSDPGSVVSTGRNMYIRVDHECSSINYNLTGTIAFEGSWLFILLYFGFYRKRLINYYAKF